MVAATFCRKLQSTGVKRRTSQRGDYHTRLESPATAEFTGAAGERYHHYRLILAGAHQRQLRNHRGLIRSLRNTMLSAFVASTGATGPATKPSVAADPVR